MTHKNMEIKGEMSGWEKVRTRVRFGLGFEGRVKLEKRSFEKTRVMVMVMVYG